MVQYTNVFSQSPVQPSGSSYNQINLTEDITLQWPTSFQDVSTVTGNIMDVIADDNDPFFVLSLPNATQVSPGMQMIINNAGGNSFTLSDNAGGELIGDFQVGHVWQIYLTDNSTAAGAWGIIPSGAGVAGVTRVEAETTSDGLTITGSPITGSGTLGFELSDTLNALSDFNTTGYMVATAVDTFDARQLVAGTGMAILNPDGVAGNTTLSVNTTLNGMVSIGVGNLNLANNSITSTNGNGNIAVTPNGTGSVALGSNVSPVTIDTNSNITNVGTLTATSFIGAQIPDLLVSFSLNLTMEGFCLINYSYLSMGGNVTVECNSVDNPLQNGIYTMRFSNPLPSINLILSPCYVEGSTPNSSGGIINIGSYTTSFVQLNLKALGTLKVSDGVKLAIWCL